VGVAFKQEQRSLFVAFADDPQERPFRVDGWNGKCNGFADLQVQT
jgi:hypothetical protein